MDSSTVISRISLLRRRSKTFWANANVPCIFFSLPNRNSIVFFDLPLVCDQYRIKTSLLSKCDSSKTQILLTIRRFLDENFICENVKSTSPRCARILVSSFEKPCEQIFLVLSFRCFDVPSETRAKGIARYWQLKQLIEFVARSRVCYSFLSK